MFYFMSWGMGSFVSFVWRVRVWFPSSFFYFISVGTWYSTLVLADSPTCELVVCGCVGGRGCIDFFYSVLSFQLTVSFVVSLHLSKSFYDF